MGKQIKVLSVIDTLGSGGAERVLVNTLLELSKMGIECEVVILFSKDDLANELKGHGIKVHKLFLSNKWNIFEGMYKLNILVKSSNFDIVHAHLFFSYFYTGLIKIFNKNIKTVTTFHNLAYNTYPANTIIRRTRKKVDSFIVNNLIDAKTAVSSAVKKHYEKHLKISFVELIPNSFPLQQITTNLELDNTKILNKYLDKTKYHYFSITPGRLVQEKGHKYLLEAMEKIEHEGIQLCHFIVGSGPLKYEIEEDIKNKKLQNTILIDSLKQEELFKLIISCDFVVIPSVSEGFGMVVGEAMALKKPIITTNIDGIRDLVEDEKDALLIQVKDSAALYETMKRLLYDVDLQSSLSKNALKKINTFDVKTIGKHWKLYYEKMLNE